MLYPPYVTRTLPNDSINKLSCVDAIMTQQLITTLAEKSGYSESKIQELVQAKLTEFSGLVSEEGAVYLVAKELDVNLVEQAEKKDLKIQNILPGMRKVDLKGKVIRIQGKHQFNRSDGSEGEVQNIVIADETGTIRIVLWDKQTTISDNISEGDVLEIQNAYSREGMYQQCEVHLHESSRVNKGEPQDIGEVADYNVNFTGKSENVNISEINSEGVNYEFHGTLVNVSAKNPLFTVCPSCGKKVTRENETYSCEVHGSVNPVNAVVMSGFVDDGKGCVRCVFFRDVAQQLLGLETLSNVSEEGVREKAHLCVGSDVWIGGRSQRNDYVNALEVVANDVKVINPRDHILNVMTKNTEVSV